MKTKRVLCWPLVVGMLSGCGSGTGSSLPSATPTSAPSGGTSSTLKHVSVSIVIPKRTATKAARGRAFVSPSTQGVAVEVTHGSNGMDPYDVVTNYNVSSGSSSTCVGTNPEVCSLVIPAPVAPSPDFDTFAFTLYDQAPGGSTNSFAASANAIGSGSTTASIGPNVANTISAYVGGVPSELAFIAGGNTQIIVSGDGYLGFTAPVGAQAQDIDLNSITGGPYDPYEPAFEIGVVEPQPPAGSTLLSLTPASVTGLTPAPPTCNAAASDAATVSTCRSTDAITVSYLQTASTNFDTQYYSTVTSGTASVVADTPLYVAPIFVLDTTDPANSASGPSFAQGAPSMSPLLQLNGGSGSVTPQEFGATVEGTSLTFSADENANCSGVIASNGISQDASNNFTISGLPLASESDNGGCIVTFSDGIGGSVQLAVSDTGATTPVTMLRRQQRTKDYQASGRTVRR